MTVKEVDLSDGVISIKTFSDAVTKVLRSVELRRQPLLVSKRGRIFAALVPISARQLVASMQATPSVAPDPSKVNRREAEDALGMLRDTVFHEPRSDPANPDLEKGSVSVRELTRGTTKVLRAVENGQALLVTRHSAVIAILLPYNAAAALSSLISADPTLERLIDVDARSKLRGSTRRAADVLEGVDVSSDDPAYVVSE